MAARIVARKKRKRRDKSIDQEHHAKKRFAQRFGVVICNDTYRDMVKQIQTGQAQFIEKQSNRVSKFWVQWGDRRVPVVYDKQRGKVVTVLLPEWVEPVCP